MTRKNSSTKKEAINANTILSTFLEENISTLTDESTESILQSIVKFKIFPEEELNKNLLEFLEGFKNNLQGKSYPTSENVYKIVKFEHELNFEASEIIRGIFIIEGVIINHLRDNFITKKKILLDILDLVNKWFSYTISLHVEAFTSIQMASLNKQFQSETKNLNEFAYKIAHDLRAPLRGIKGFIDLLKLDNNNVLSLESETYINKIINQTSYMDALIEGVLDYSKLGYLEIHRDRVDIRNILDDILSIILLPNHIQIILEEPFPIIFADKTQITQIFQNLLDNAIKFNDKSQGKIQIGVKDRKNFWEFYITDNGCGIEEKNYDRIFQLFQQIVSSEKSKPSGRNIGLPIVKRIIELYGGKIWIQSTIGKETTFYFTLPKQT